MSKLKDFLSQKLHNFKLFLDEQIEIVKKEYAEIPEEKYVNMKKDIENFEQNLNLFIQQMNFLQGKEIDECVKIFLQRYEIDIEKIKTLIDYPKLKKYIEMFLEVIKN